MEPGRQQAVRSDKKGWGCDAARSASFNAHYQSLHQRPPENWVISQSFRRNDHLILVDAILPQLQRIPAEALNQTQA